jgi:type I site-specific restriction endonuclease
MDKYQLSERDICTKFITPAIQQASWQPYAEMLDVPFAISSNGDGFLFHDRTGISYFGEIEETGNQLKSELAAALTHHFVQDADA